MTSMQYYVRTSRQAQSHTWRLLLISLIQLSTVASSWLINAACFDTFRLPLWHHILSSITFPIGTQGWSS